MAKYCTENFESGKDMLKVCWRRDKHVHDARFIGTIQAALARTYGGSWAVRAGSYQSGLSTCPTGAVDYDDLNEGSLTADITPLRLRPQERAATSADGKPSYLSQANNLGQGFNIFGRQLDPESLMEPLFNFAKAPTQVFTLLDEDYLIPVIINPILNTQSYDDEDVCHSREEFEDKIAMEVGVSGGYGAFKGEFELHYSSATGGSTDTVYAFKKSFLPVATLQLMADEAFPYLNAGFQARVNSLPAVVTSDNFNAFAGFFNDYGVYYVNAVVLGGLLEFYVSLENSEHWSKTDISTKMNAEWDGAMVTGKLDASLEKDDSWKTYKSHQHYNLHTVGGAPTDAMALSHIDPSEPSQATVDKYTAWANSVAHYPGLVQYKLEGIWALCGDKRAVVRQAWEQFGDQFRTHITIETHTHIDTSLFVKTPAYGNPGYPFAAQSTVQPVRLWSIHSDGDKITGFKWTYFEGTEHSIGDVNQNNDWAHFEFLPGETLKTCTLYMSEYGNYGRSWDGSWYGLEFETSQGRHLVTRTSGWAHKLDEFVAGRCLMGFHGGTHNSDNVYIWSIGFWLSPPVAAWPAPQPEPPLVMVADKQIRPQASPTANCGFHVVVTDGRHSTDRAAIRLNRYYTLPNVPAWRYSPGEREALYNAIVQDIQSQQLDQNKDNLLILSSFGMDLHLSPTPSAYTLFQTAGAGDQLEQWRTQTETGPLPDWGQNTLCNYILVGYFGSHPGDGTELFAVGDSAKLTTDLSPRTHYRRSA